MNTEHQLSALVVEDDMDNYMQITQLLRDAGIVDIQFKMSGAAVASAANEPIVAGPPLVKRFL